MTKHYKELKSTYKELAIKRAEALFLEKKYLPYHRQKPVTLVYKLVQLLNENKR